MKTKVSLIIVFVVLAQFVFGQCTIKQPRVDSSNRSLCQNFCLPIRAYSKDTIIWYKVADLDTIRLGVGIQTWDTISEYYLNDLKPGLHNYLVTSKNGCESSFTPLQILIKASTVLSMPKTLNLGYYDTTLSVSVIPHGGRYSWSGLPENTIIIDGNPRCGEFKSIPSHNTDTSYTIRRNDLLCHYNYTLVYTYYNEEGCGSSFESYYKLPSPPAPPKGPSSYTFKFENQNKIVRVEGDSAAFYLWYINGNQINLPITKHNSINLDSIFSVMPLFPMSIEIFVKQSINGYESDFKRITINYVICLATQPIVASALTIKKNGDPMPVLTATTTSNNCELRWYDLATFNTNKELRGVGASFVPVNCGDYCVVSYDTVDACASSSVQASIKEICSMSVKPLIDSIITDTIYYGYSGRTFSIANTLLPNQSCKWYINDSNA